MHGNDPGTQDGCKTRKGEGYDKIIQQVFIGVGFLLVNIMIYKLVVIIHSSVVVKVILYLEKNQQLLVVILL